MSRSRFPRSRALWGIAAVAVVAVGAFAYSRYLASRTPPEPSFRINVEGSSDGKSERAVVANDGGPALNVEVASEVLVLVDVPASQAGTRTVVVRLVGYYEPQSAASATPPPTTGRIAILVSSPATGNVAASKRLLSETTGLLEQRYGDCRLTLCRIVTIGSLSGQGQYADRRSYWLSPDGRTVEVSADRLEQLLSYLGDERHSVVLGGDSGKAAVEAAEYALSVQSTDVGDAARSLFR
jgi:hypothetical protein